MSLYMLYVQIAGKILESDGTAALTNTITPVINMDQSIVEPLGTLGQQTIYLISWSIETL